MLDLLPDSVTAAQNLLGMLLVHATPAGRVGGYIVEAEAYRSDDSASHSFRGITPRTAPMFEVAGTVYVYFTYGMHYCVNIVSGGVGDGQAVLIRALEPVEGLDIMRTNRGLSDVDDLTNGPGKLTQALGINKALTGTKLNHGALSLVPGVPPREIVQTTRIGIRKAVDQPWRFYIKNNPFVSRKV